MKENINKTLLEARIREYMTRKLKEEFGSDFDLIKDAVNPMIDRYSYKELIILLRLEIARLKKTKPE